MKSHLKSIFQKSILNDFSIEKNLKICFCKKNLIFSQNIFSRDFFSFRKKICFEKKLPISIRNCLKIPKIALRKSCDKFKAVKNKKSEFFYKFYAILVIFSHVLGISTLKSDTYLSQTSGSHKYRPFSA